MRLKQIRTELGLTQMSVALRAGVSPALVSTIETYDYVPKKPEVRAKLATALGRDEGDIFPQLATVAH